MLLQLGEKYQIRSFSGDDVPSLAHHANNPKIARNLRDSFPCLYSESDAQEWVEYVNNQTLETHFAIALGKDAIGVIGLELHGGMYAKLAEIGYWLGEPYWGRGVATQALQTFTNYALTTYELMLIFAIVIESNSASIRVLEKANYTIEKRFHKSIVKNGEDVSSIIYSITNG